MIGTTRDPNFSSRAKLRSKRVNPMVVLTDCSPDPPSSSLNTVSAGSSSGRRARTMRFGMDPPNARRRSMRYWYSTEPSLGRKYGGTSPTRAESGISSLRCKRSRRARICSAFIFLIWCVALRPSMSGPSVQPLTVLHRIAVGRPLPRFCAAAR